MPELPEVETITRGLQSQILNKKIKKIIIRQPKLRWPIPNNIYELEQLTIKEIQRRGKYILFKFAKIWLIIHLGMSGSLKIVNKKTPIRKHDHADFEFTDFIMRYHDPRRFGTILCTDQPETHFLLKNLGLEPFDKNFSAEYLFQKTRKAKAPIKSFLMNSKHVVGVGNIYAAECLFLAGIHPLRVSNTITMTECNKLVKAIKAVLTKAIKEGGTTLKDFVNSEGNPGYFAHSLKTYGRAGAPCVKCQNPLTQQRIGQRSTVFCNFCQV